MDIIYVIRLLIGTFCVLFFAYVGLAVKIRLDCRRRENCSKEKKRKEYGKVIRRFRCLRKIINYVLVADMIVDIMCMSGSADQINADDTESGLVEIIETVRIDPKMRLLQNTEEKVGNICNNVLFSPWEGEAESREKEYYRERLDEILEGRAPISDKPEEALTEEEKMAYDVYLSQLEIIEQMKVPEGASLEDVQTGKVSPLMLDAGTYKEEYQLRDKCYLLCPMAENLQQKARAALDVQTAMVRYLEEYGDEWDEIIEYALYGIEGYLSLFFFASSRESKADCCYWIAKTFYDLAEKMPDKYKNHVRHCYLMAYTFAEKGLCYKNMGSQEDDHIAGLENIKNKADLSLGM